MLQPVFPDDRLIVCVDCGASGLPNPIDWSGSFLFIGPPLCRNCEQKIIEAIGENNIKMELFSRIIESYLVLYEFWSRWI